MGDTRTHPEHDG